MSNEESVSYFKHLENFEKIRCTNGPNPSSLKVDNNKIVSVTSSVSKSSKNHKRSNMWYHYCDKNNQQQLNQSKEIVRLVEIGSLKKTIPLNGLLHHLKFLRKQNNKNYH
jgi:Tol biopolymer transport system component